MRCGAGAGCTRAGGATGVGRTGASCGATGFGETGIGAEPMLELAVRAGVGTLATGVCGAGAVGCAVVGGVTPAFVVAGLGARDGVVPAPLAGDAGGAMGTRRNASSRLGRRRAMDGLLACSQTGGRRYAASRRGSTRRLVATGVRPVPPAFSPARRTARHGPVRAPSDLGLLGLVAVLSLSPTGCGGAAEPKPPASAKGAPATAERGSSAPDSSLTQAARPADLVDEAAARGLDYRNVSGSPEKRVILEANGAGVALLDLGRDGDLDVVFAQGAASVDGDFAAAKIEVFENVGGGNFRRATLANLILMWTTGLATGDVDGDGDDDLVVGGLGGIFVYLQGADGKLAVNSQAIPSAVFAVERGAGRSLSWFTSIALFDADHDGVLDLYAGRYLDLDPASAIRDRLGDGPLAVPCTWKSYPVFCGPAGLVAQPDVFLHGRGDGTFEDRSATALPGHVPGYTLGVLPFDADGDGDTDVFVANDSTPNLLLINDGRGVFTDVARAAGVALSSEGRMQAGMGVASGDVNRDGLLDFAVTNFSDEPTELYFGAAQGFRRMTNALGLLRETRSLLSWGVHLVDFDGDGWLELFTTNGHVYPQADEPNTGTRYGQPAALWRLGPGDKATRIEPRGTNSILAPAIGARGSAVGDLDLDGAPDIVLARIDAPAALGMDGQGAQNARLAVRLLGPDAPTESAPRTPRDGHGAKAILVVGTGAREHALLGEVQTAAGFQSASSPWLHFGLGAAQSYAKLIVRWPSGRVEELPGGAAGARITVREGAGVVAREAFR